jgi:transcriptional regulator with XRE-family HTH domain
MTMVVGDHLGMLREQKQLSQGDIEDATGLLRCYTSRVENNHTIPSVETLEKWAPAMKMHLYQVLYDGPELPEVSTPLGVTTDGWGHSGKDARYLAKLRRYLSQMTPSDRSVLMEVFSQLVRLQGRNLNSR